MTRYDKRLRKYQFGPFATNTSATTNEFSLDLSFIPYTWCFLQLSRDLPSNFVRLSSELGHIYFFKPCRLGTAHISTLESPTKVCLKLVAVLPILRESFFFFYPFVIFLTLRYLLIFVRTSCIHITITSFFWRFPKQQLVISYKRHKDGNMITKSHELKRLEP